MSKTAKKTEGKIRRRRRIRARVSGTPDRPRLSFFRSNKHIYAQVIDDTAGQTLVGISSAGGEEKGAVASAKRLGADVAKRALEKNITSVVFDRGGFVYTGSVKEFADAVRQGGLQF